MDFTANQVVITHSSSLADAESDDATGTLRIKTDNVALYNIDVRNDFGVAQTNHWPGRGTKTAPTSSVPSLELCIRLSEVEVNQNVCARTGEVRRVDLRS